jgi:hypothetical protein
MSPDERAEFDEWLSSPTSDEVARMDAANQYARQVVSGAG